MADVMAIVSKAVFEKTAGKSPKVGELLKMDRYVSANKGLAALADGGKLYLVTVRPPNEAMWLVGVLDRPTFDGKQWVSKPSPVPITDITKLRSKLTFESGKGITAAAGALGMSLQTPRVLTAADVALLDGAAPAGTAGSKPAGIPAPTKVDANTGERAQGSSLLSAVIEDPSSDAPRQVYADSLQARHDPRGELIVIDLALAGPLSIRRRDMLKQRRGELVKAHGAMWWPYKKLATRTHRGFIESVSGTFNKVNGVADQLFSTEPVVELHLADFSEAAAAKLIGAPWLRHIRHLVIKGKLGDDAFGELVAAPNAQQLESLNVTSAQLSQQAMAYLGANLPACRTLVLTGNPIKDDGIESLLAWKHLGQLEILYLSNCKLTSVGVTKLVGVALPTLVKLTLSNNKLDDQIGTSISLRAKNLPALRTLELDATGVGLPVVALLDKAALPNLARVDVRRNRIPVADVAALPRFRGR